MLERTERLLELIPVLLVLSLLVWVVSLLLGADLATSTVVVGGLLGAVAATK